MPKNLAAEVAHSLRQRIDSGEWSDTRRLPNERELAAEYSVARNTLQARLTRLPPTGLCCVKSDAERFCVAMPKTIF